MTAKKPRKVRIYTNNIAVVGLVDFAKPLARIIEKYFEQDPAANGSGRIFDAIASYNIALKLNPNRQSTSEQNADRYELIACMKELQARLFVLHIPMPLLRGAQAAYVPHQCGKSTLQLEIRDLLRRIGYLQELFDRTTIPKPTWTNRGKDERNQLIVQLETIFDDLARCSYLPSPIEVDSSVSKMNAERRMDRKRFVRDVFAVFNLPPPP